MEMPVSTKTPLKKILNILAVVICVVLIPLIIANFTIIVKSFVNPNEVPGVLGYKPFIVLSGSMVPLISSGDIVLVKEQEAENLKQGDIIAFREGNSVITHRIVKVDEVEGKKQFTTRGDNNNAEDLVAVKEEMVEGKYLLAIPYAGNAALFIQTPIGMILFIAMPLMLFIFYDILRRRRFDREKQKMTRELETELEKMRQQLISAENKDNTVV